MIKKDKKKKGKGKKDENLTLSTTPTSRRENNRFSLCPDSYFVQRQIRN